MWLPGLSLPTSVLYGSYAATHIRCHGLRYSLPFTHSIMLHAIFYFWLLIVSLFSYLDDCMSSINRLFYYQRLCQIYCSATLSCDIKGTFYVPLMIFCVTSVITSSRNLTQPKGNKLQLEERSLFRNMTYKYSKWTPGSFERVCLSSANHWKMCQNSTLMQVSWIVREEKSHHHGVAKYLWRLYQCYPAIKIWQIKAA